MHVIVNGESRALSEAATLADLIRQLGVNQRRIAVELNREIIAREEYASCTLAEGDQVEIVHFVGGG